MITLKNEELIEINGGMQNGNQDQFIIEWQRSIALEWIYYIMGRAVR